MTFLHDCGPYMEKTQFIEITLNDEPERVTAHSSLDALIRHFGEADPDLIFSDLDVMTIGPVVKEVSKAFDKYWNSELAYPASVLLKDDPPTPEKVEKLVIADIAPKDYMLLKQEGQFYLHQNILLAMQDIDFSMVKSRNDVDDFLAEKIDDERIRMFLLKNVEKNKKTKQFQWRVNHEVLYDYLEEIVGGVNIHWLDDRIPITAYPVIFIRGLLSKYIQDEDKELIKEIYPEARIVDIPEAGHWLHAEQPQKFAEAVFLCC